MPRARERARRRQVRIGLRCERDDPDRAREAIAQREEPLELDRAEELDGMRTRRPAEERAFEVDAENARRARRCASREAVEHRARRSRAARSTIVGRQPAQPPSTSSSTAATISSTDPVAKSVAPTPLTCTSTNRGREQEVGMRDDGRRGVGRCAGADRDDVVAVDERPTPAMPRRRRRR